MNICPKKYYDCQVYNPSPPDSYSSMYQIRRPLGLVFVIYFWWLGELLLLYI